MPAIRPRSRFGIVLAALSVLALALAGPASAHGGGKGANVYTKRNLVSDIPGVARITDPNLVNPWGLSAGPATPLWVSDNGTDVSTLYSGAIRRSIPVTLPLVVGIPGGAPTGTVFNPTSGLQGGRRAGALHLRLRGRADHGMELGPRRRRRWRRRRAPVYKGLAIATKAQAAFLYAANFHAAQIDVFDHALRAGRAPPGAFVDPDLPAGFAPFNVQELAGRIFVSYAKQDADRRRRRRRRQRLRRRLRHERPHAQAAHLPGRS